MEKIHDFPENRRRCVIFTARCEGEPRDAVQLREDDYILCADAGYLIARAMGAKPHCVLGDFDSAALPDSGNVEYMPPEYEKGPDGAYRLIEKSSFKNTSEGPEEGRVLCFASEKMYTDTMMCLTHGMAMGFDDFIIVGGFGGRADHTIANLQALKYAAARGVKCVMCDGHTWAAAIVNGEVEVPARDSKLSVFAMDPVCRGIWLRDVKYPLENAVLTNDITLGISNEFLPPDESGAQKSARIRVDDGALLIICCTDRAGSAGCQ